MDKTLGELEGTITENMFVDGSAKPFHPLSKKSTANRCWESHNSGLPAGLSREIFDSGSWWKIPNPQRYISYWTIQSVQFATPPSAHWGPGLRPGCNSFEDPQSKLPRACCPAKLVRFERFFGNFALGAMPCAWTSLKHKETLHWQQPSVWVMFKIHILDMNVYQPLTFPLQLCTYFIPFHTCSRDGIFSRHHTFRANDMPCMDRRGLETSKQSVSRKPFKVRGVYYNPNTQRRACIAFQSPSHLNGCSWNHRHIERIFGYRKGLWSWWIGRKAWPMWLLKEPKDLGRGNLGPVASVRSQSSRFLNPVYNPRIKRHQCFCYQKGKQCIIIYIIYIIMV